MAQTLKFGNKVWAAKEDSVLAYNDINNNYKPLPFTFSRASIGTRVNKDGLIETMGQDIARIDYTDSADGVLLLEPARTNLLPYSNDFSNSAWQKNAIGTGLAPVVTPNSLISPDGTLNASKVVFNTGAGTSTSDISMLEDTVSSTSGVSINQSVYLKGENGGETILIRGANGSSYTTLILTNKWVRYNATETSGATSSTWAIGLRQGLGGVLINSTATIYMAFAQFELGDYPTSYIPTNGTAVTRAEETCNNSGNSEVFNDSEGVLFGNISALADTQQNRFLGINDGSNSNRVVIGYTSVSSNTPRVIVTSGGSTQAAIDSSINDIRQPIKIAAKYKLNDVDLWLNGFKVGSDTSAIMPIGLTNSSFDSDGVGGADFYGKTKEVGYYNTILTDAELETLTSYRNWVSMVNELNLNIIYNG